jgi:p-cumate 2,3-dioxygenase beta subunit
MSEHAIRDGRAAAITRAQVEDFLFEEAGLLDNWRLDDWLGLFTEDAIYEIPTTDALDGRPDQDLFIMADTMEVLRGRVTRLKSVNAFAESPRSRTRRMIGNVRILGATGDTLEITANFRVARLRKGNVDDYIGAYESQLAVGDDGQLRFRRRRVLLDHDALRPHGKISIIL